MRPTPLSGYVCAMAALIGGFLLTPDSTWAHVGWPVAVSVAALAATVYGVRRYRPVAAVAWLLFAVGVFLNASGVLVESIVFWLNPLAEPPNPADAFWLALYPCLAAGMVILHRSRTRTKDWSTTVDAATITTGLGLLSWVFVIRPSTGDEYLSLLGHAVVVAYPVGDIVVLALMTRLLLSGGARVPALRLLVGSLLTFLVGDVLWVVWSQLDVEVVGLGGKLMTAIFLVAYATVGAAALHPSLREAGEPSTQRRGRVSPALLAALTVAALIAPAVQLTQAFTGVIVDGVAIAISSTVLFLLVVTRLAGLLRRVDTQARQLRELSRVDALTGLPNRRAWASELPAALERARRGGHPVSVAMVDLDRFKLFNDEFGHPAGDRLLKSAAAAWREQLRTVDLLARYGGEEFILLLSDVESPGAADLVERLRPVTPLGQTFSAGIATWDGVETSDELVTRADQALYVAKNTGRNRTALADGAPATIDA
jgi:diguanylate cyclase (GGDEF)-like protein